MNDSLALAQHIPAVLPSGLQIPWRAQLPTLAGSRVVLRELQVEDAEPLLRVLATPDVARYMSAPPTSVDRLADFIEWGQRERAAGRYAGFAVVPQGSDAVAGLLQIRQLDPGFYAAEWGFALGADQWGSGVFLDGAHLLADFAFDTLGVHRLEARAAVDNARGHAAMRKLGAVQEGLLRRALVTADGVAHDQVLWSLLADDWRASNAADVVRVH